MITLHFDMIQTVGLAIRVYYLGRFFLRISKTLRKFFIPAPVVGGFVFSIIRLILQVNGVCTIVFDQTLQMPFMMVFFTAIGVSADVKMLKIGGRNFLLFWLISIGVILLQNFLGISLAQLISGDKVMGLMMGSTSLLGGFGTVGAWNDMYMEKGLLNAKTIGFAMATIGSAASALTGGPVAELLIKNKKLSTPNFDKTKEPKKTFDIKADGQQTKPLVADDFIKVLGLIFVSVGIGVILQRLIKENVSIMGVQLNLPSYVTSMIIAMIYVNTIGKVNGFSVNIRAATLAGNIALNIFLCLALIDIDLMQLKDAALDLVVIMIAQTIFIFLYAYYVNFYFMGRNYEAAVLSSGLCGFSLGATYNALANMDSIIEHHGPAPMAYLVLPLVGAFAIDITNSIIITLFINFL